MSDGNQIGLDTYEYGWDIMRYLAIILSSGWLSHTLIESAVMKHSD